jgi:hypothetical protein
MLPRPKPRPRVPANSRGRTSEARQNTGARTGGGIRWRHPLSVVAGQYFVVTVNLAPTPYTPDASTATLLINGDTWDDPVSIPITAPVGQISVEVTPISVVERTLCTAYVRLTLVAGAAKTAHLIFFARNSAKGAERYRDANPASAYCAN